MRDSGRASISSRSLTRRAFVASAMAGLGLGVSACASGCTGATGGGGSSQGAACGDPELAMIQDSEQRTRRITIVIGGDVLVHRGIWESGQRSDGTRNYDHLFAPMAPTFQAADIAIVNQETILGGVEMGISGYPLFNSPQEIGDAEAAAGVDVVLAATNHALDMGFDGIAATLKFWRERHPEVLVTGIADSGEAADAVRLITRDGITVAILNYAETTNGIPDPPDRPYCVKRLQRSDFAADVARAREAGADLVIACPHWGTEYAYVPNGAQRGYADALVAAGVDAVIGTHPHVLQPLELLSAPDGSNVPVFWSLGNLVSRQLETPRTLGGLAVLTVEKTGEACAIVEAALEPTVMHKDRSGGAEMRAYRLADYSDELASRNIVEPTDDFPTFTVDGCHAFAAKVLGPEYDRDAASLTCEVNAPEA